MNDYQTKLEQFAALLQVQSQIQCKLSGVGCQANLDNCRTRIVPGRKYDKVNVGGSGRFMVDRTTGEIFGIKGYGQVHTGHRYGTLDTLTSWWWGRYDTRRITASYPAPAGWEAMVPTCSIETAAEKGAALQLTCSPWPYVPTERTADATVSLKLNLVDTSKPEASRTEIHVTTDSAYPSLIINGHAL